MGSPGTASPRPQRGLWWVAAALAWLLGAAAQMRSEHTLPPVQSLAGGAAAAAVALGAWLSARRGTTASAAWRSLSIVSIGAAAFFSTDWRASDRLAAALPSELQRRDVVVTGVVAGLPQRQAKGLRLRLEVEHAEIDGVPVSLPPVLSLGWYSNGWRGDTLPLPDVRAGERWRLAVRLRQPHGLANPHGFDYELWAFEQGVDAVGSVRPQPAPLRLDEAAAHPLDRLRQRVRDAIEARVEDRRLAGVLAALSVGDQSAIDREDWDLFRDTGIAHLVSISGLHVTMFAWLATALIGALWRRSRQAMVWWPAPIAARWGGVLLAAAYALFSGWGVPSQRTVWMLATVTLLRSGGVLWPWPLVLLTAAVVVTVGDPWALLQVGFWLSFAAVALLIASGSGGAAEGRDTPPVAEPAEAPVSRLTRLAAALSSAVRGGLRTQLVATVGLAPLTLVFFHQLSVVGFVANLVAIPLVTLAITPLALLGVVAPPLWSLGAALVQALCAFLGTLAAWPGAVWMLPAAPGWAAAAGLLGGALLVLPGPWRLRLLALPLAAGLLLPPVLRPPEGRFELVAVDVGQGTAVLVRTRHHLLVYDTGPQYGPDSDAGERVLLPLLRARGERRIDRLVLSHRDSDHVGGAGSLLRALPVGALLHSLEPSHPLLAQAAAEGSHFHGADDVAGRDVLGCAAGQRWQWDGVRFEVLHPAEALQERAAKSNATSCVVRVDDASGASALLTGDIERPQEQALAEHPAALHADLLMVAHHGSRTSSTEAFIEAVAPRIAVVQAGYLNRFGHPAPDIAARYLDRGITLVRSDSCGAFTWQSDQVDGYCQRRLDPRYWQHRLP